MVTERVVAVRVSTVPSKFKVGKSVRACKDGCPKVRDGETLGLSWLDRGEVSAFQGHGGKLMVNVNF